LESGSVAGDYGGVSISPGLFVFAVVLIIMGSFFSMSETSLTSLSAVKVRSMLDAKVKNARIIDRLLRNRERLIGSILIGSNFAAIAFSSIVTAIALQIARYRNEGVVMAIATIISTIIIVVITDITPKTIASRRSEGVARLVSRPLSIVLKVLSPISHVLNLLIMSILSKFGFKNNGDEGTITESELKTMLEVGREEGLLQSDQSEMIENVFEFKQSLARECMIPRTEIVGISVDSEYAEVMEIFAKEKYTRLPVFRDDADHIIGVLNFKDFIFSDCAAEDFEVGQYMREPFFAYEAQPTRKLFAAMRREGLSLAVVMDEYGGTSGILTIEDLVEEIVGEIFDEHDQIDEEIRCIAANLEYLAPGFVKIEDFNEVVGTQLISEDYETLAGYVLGLFGYIPKPGESISEGGERVTTFIVEAVDKNRIEEIRILFKDA